MKITTFITLLFLISYDLFGFFEISNTTTQLLILLVLIFYGFVFKKRSNLLLNIYANKKYIYFFLAILIISTFHPLYNFGQSFFETMISLRVNYLIIVLLLLIHMRPSENDIIKVFKFCSYLAISIAILSSFLPDLFISNDMIDAANIRRYNEIFEVFYFTPGVDLVFFYFIFITAKIKKEKNKKHIIEAVVLLVFLILVQNRSRLAFAIPFFVFMFLSKNKFKPIQILVFFSVTATILNKYFMIFYNQINESLFDLSNNDYSRIKTLDYIYNSIINTPYTFFTGNGVSSSNSEYLEMLQLLQYEDNIYIADLGLIGGFYNFGILFLIFIYSFCFKSFKSYQPFYMKCFSVYIILIPSIQGFGTNYFLGPMVFFCFYFYLIFYFESIEKARLISYEK